MVQFQTQPYALSFFSPFSHSPLLQYSLLLTQGLFIKKLREIISLQKYALTLIEVFRVHLLYLQAELQHLFHLKMEFSVTSDKINGEVKEGIFFSCFMVTWKKNCVGSSKLPKIIFSHLP